MTKVTIKRHVKAPPSKVFAVASDFPNGASIVKAIEKTEMLTPGPVGVGTRFRETRTMFGRSATEEMSVSAFNPPRSFALSAESHGARYETTFTFTEKDGGTEIEMCFGVQPITFMAKVMGVLMKPMMKKMVAMCAKDLDDIAAVAEA
jgi:Polyketide cyclase / dehydrase and lipid transport